MKRAIALIALTGLSLAANLAPAAEPLGRFFFTPAQRAQLDTARSQKSRATLASEQTDEAAAAQPLPEILTYSGSVRRSDGKSTIWLNNRAVHDQQTVEGLAVIGRVQRNGEVSLQVPNRTIELKPGQSVDIGSGTVEEPFARQVTAPKPEPKPAGAESAAGKPAPGKLPAPGEKAAASASTPEQKVLDSQVESALERLRRTRPEGIGNAPDRR